MLTTWRTSTYSDSGGQPQCIEVGVTWRTSTYSQSGGQSQCVEIGIAPGRVGVRDSKDRERGHFTVARTTWAAFARASARGELAR